jgi:hypothetical protein
MPIFILIGNHKTFRRQGISRPLIHENGLTNHAELISWFMQGSDETLPFAVPLLSHNQWLVDGCIELISTNRRFMALLL